MSIIDDLKQEEGFRSHYYKDSRGFLTIGYGYNLDKGMSEKVASALLELMVEEKVIELKAAIPFWNTLSQERKDVFVDMAYNMGTSGLLKFKNMLKAAEQGDIESVCNEMKNSAWYSQVGNRAVKLVEKYRKV